MSEIALRWAALKETVAALEKKYHRPAGTVQILAVTKMQSVADIQSALDAGIRMVGENYLQEALQKIPLLAALSPEWHFIGRLQSNKTRHVAAHFAWVHSVTSAKLAQRLHDHRPNHLPPLNMCIQINVDAENNRGGIDEKEALSLADYCRPLHRLRLRGLMALPTLNEDPQVTREAFHRLHACYTHLQQQGFSLDTLSAGTTHDLEAAIAEGSTLIRVGTALFGLRKKNVA